MYYKLTDQNMQTYNGFQWKLGKWYEISIENQGYDLCSKSWFHCYSHPLLAVLLNPLHADINNPRLFEIEVGGQSRDDNGLKFGFTRMTLVKEIKVPKITTDQKVRFAILCALEVYDDKDFRSWAQDWLSNKDKTKIAKAARAAAEAAWTGWATTEADNGIAWAAKAAAEATTAALAAAVAATVATAEAARAAARAKISLNLIELAERAIQ